jgi:hypothetical protein
MKRETTHYVAECDTCRRVMSDHMRSAGLLQPLSIPTWKWEDISIDFIVGLPLTGRKFNSIWVIVELYVSHILCLHGVLKTIISDREP